MLDVSQLPFVQAWGALVGGAAVGAAGSIVGDILSAAMSGSRAKKAYQRQKNIMKHEVQWRVQDLIAAGINPMLAAGQGAVPASVAPATTPAFEGLRDAGRAISELPRRAQELTQGSAQIDYTRSQTNLSQASALESIQRRQTGEKEAALKDQERLLAVARTLTEGEKLLETRAHRGYLEASAKERGADAYFKDAIRVILENTVESAKREAQAEEQGVEGLLNRVLEGATSSGKELNRRVRKQGKSDWEAIKSRGGKLLRGAFDAFRNTK